MSASAAVLVLFGPIVKLDRSRAFMRRHFLHVPNPPIDHSLLRKMSLCGRDPAQILISTSTIACCPSQRSAVEILLEALASTLPSVQA
jgi:hypothetical protein